MALKSNKTQSAAFYIKGVLSGDMATLSRAITLVESTNKSHQILAKKVLEGIFKKTGNSFRLGVSGVPGVGKSTFIESFGKVMVKRGHKLAVLTVDPSSNKSKGSILGDKTRMEELSTMQNVYIRPSPNSGTLGGVARTTFETILLCEAAGFDFIIVETVGVGQSEISVSQMTDFFLLLMLAGAGDELQGIKRGIMEMADGIVITKADGNNIQKAKSARAEYANSVHLFPPTDSGWIPKVTTCSAVLNEGIEEIVTTLEKYKKFVKANNYFSEKRILQHRLWLYQNVSDRILEKFYNSPSVKKEIQKFEKSLQKQMINPYSVAASILKKWNKIVS